jgi:hypothetical protein
VIPRLEAVLVRLRRGPRTHDSSASTRHEHRGNERRSPSGVLTAWLRQGVRNGICPLCRVAHRADREYIWHFFDESADRGESIDEVRRACGFCAEHIEMLSRIETEGMKSTLAISVMFADTFAGVLSDLESLSSQAAFVRAQCPACASRDERVAANAEYLLDELATNPGLRDKFNASPGLCFAHFQLVWNAAQTSEEREFIRRVQRDAAARLLADLTEHVRKHDHKYRHEPKGPERDSWRRAVFMTAGWPAPTKSAAEPEEHR